MCMCVCVCVFEQTKEVQCSYLAASCVYKCMRLYVCIHVCLYVCVYVFMYACVCVCVRNVGWDKQMTVLLVRLPRVVMLVEQSMMPA
jgi:hypothetical protein